MNTIRLNNLDTYPLTEFSMTTSFVEPKKGKTIFIAFENNNDEHQSIYKYGNILITSIELLYNNEVIYTLNNISAHLNYIHEDLAENCMRINLDLILED